MWTFTSYFSRRRHLTSGCFQDQLAIMLISYIFLGVSLLNSLHDFHVSTQECGERCEDPPVFTPSRLIVKHGDPTNAACTVCQNCKSTTFSLEKNLGRTEKNGFLISWTVDKMTEWSSDPMCYYSESGRQCCSKLPVTVYKLPDKVGLNIEGNPQEWYEGRNITLRCLVQNVAPVKNLRVTFYSGRGKLGQKESSSTGYRPQSEEFELDFSPTKEDDGVQFWCEAELLLGPEGPQPPPVVKSRNVSATVLYKPRSTGASHPNPIVVTEGNPVQLDCSAVGNPSPRYTWMVPSGVPSSFSGSVLILNSTTPKDKGQYTCVVSNSEGTVTASFEVDVKRDYTTIIIVVAVIVSLVLPSVAGYMIYKCYKKK